MHTPSGGVQIPQLALQHSRPGPHVTSPQASPPTGSQTALPSSTTHCVSGGQSTTLHGLSSGTQPQTYGEESQCSPSVQRPIALHSQSPMQSAPPCSGSQSSFGASTQVPAPGHGVPGKPPHAGASVHSPSLAMLT